MGRCFAPHRRIAPNRKVVRGNPTEPPEPQGGEGGSGIPKDFPEPQGGEGKSQGNMGGVARKGLLRVGVLLQAGECQSGRASSPDRLMTLGNITKCYVVKVKPAYSKGIGNILRNMLPQKVTLGAKSGWSD